MVSRAHGEGGGGMTVAKKNVGSAGRAGAMLNAAADLDLVKACLSCGLPVGAAVGAVADSGGSQFVDVWKGTANRLAMGVDSDIAWALCAENEVLGDFARRARRSARSGARLAANIGALLMHMRHRATDQAVAEAEKASVYVALPLSFCFLPAFIAVGLVPIAIGLLSGLS
ncbi:MAG: type II secretion system F family protein [Corynebacterium kroppenstedtii]|nr:type II secretion system F family protein [Corynebacterium kroppenstedtii]